MNKVAISALIGMAVGGSAMVAPYAGVHIPMPILMGATAALTMGAAAAVLTRSVLEKPPAKSGKDLLASSQIKRGAGTLYTKFPDGSDGSVLIAMRPDSRVDVLDVFKHPEKYVTKEIMVTLRKSVATSFNPVELKKLFTALTMQPNFLHLVLRDDHNEYIGYIPGGAAKERFTGPNAESMIARYIVDVFADPSTSDYLHEIYGASRLDWIDDEKTIADAIGRMAGGFRTLVVLDDSNRRKPLGVISYESIMGQALRGALPGAATAGGTIGAFRPTK